MEAERSDTGETVTVTCSYLWVCSGYYRYDEGFTPEFEGTESFGGRIVHPQHWPGDLDYAGKRVVVIGSGATAVTLVPAMARDAAQVTMLQRSPTYIASLPAEDPLAGALRRVLPDKAVYAIVRWKNVLLQTAFYQLSRRRPQAVKKMVRRGVERSLPAGYDIDKHFKPRYNPWDQRMCLVPDGDLFKAIRDGSASVVTDTNRDLHREGGQARLRRGTGGRRDRHRHRAQPALPRRNGAGRRRRTGRCTEDDDLQGNDVERRSQLRLHCRLHQRLLDLKADLTSEYVCRLLAHMDAHGYTKSVPEITDPSVTETPLLDFTSGYVLRSLDEFPKQGSKEPWKLRQNYIFDLRSIRRGPIDDGAMQFAQATPHVQPPREKVASLVDGTDRPAGRAV